MGLTFCMMFMMWMGDRLMSITLGSAGVGLNSQMKIFSRPRRFVGIVFNRLDREHLLHDLDKVHICSSAFLEAEVANCVWSNQILHGLLQKRERGLKVDTFGCENDVVESDVALHQGEHGDLISNSIVQIEFDKTYPTKPPPAPNSTLKTLVSMIIHIFLSCLIKYFAITMPAGHNMPPHPSLRSSSNLRGVFSMPSKSTSMTPACLSSRTGTSSSSMSKTPSLSSSDSVIGNMFAIYELDDDILEYDISKCDDIHLPSHRDSCSETADACIVLVLVDLCSCLGLHTTTFLNQRLYSPPSSILQKIIPPTSRQGHVKMQSLYTSSRVRACVVAVRMIAQGCTFSFARAARTSLSAQQVLTCNQHQTLFTSTRRLPRSRAKRRSLVATSHVSIQLASTDSRTSRRSLRLSISSYGFQSTTRTLYGTPGQGNTGPNVFRIVATDNDGSVDMSSDLARSGPLSGPTTLILQPSTAFAITFSNNLFGDPGTIQTYYATMANRTPLPSWLKFDSGSLTFWGMTPVLITGSQTYGIDFIASDVAGFAGATTSFSLLISSNQLAFNPQAENDTVVPGTTIMLGPFLDQLRINGVQATSSQLQKVVAEAPDWLTFQNDSLKLTGIPPQDFGTKSISITVTDTFGDIALDQHSATLYLHLCCLRTTSILALMSVLPHPGCTNMITLTASSGSNSEIQTLYINLKAAATAATSHTRSSTRTSPTATTISPSTTALPAKSKDESMTAGIIVGIVISCLAVLALFFAVAMLCCRRRRKEPRKKIEKSAIRPVLPYGDQAPMVAEGDNDEEKYIGSPLAWRWRSSDTGRFKHSSMGSSVRQNSRGSRQRLSELGRLSPSKRASRLIKSWHPGLGIKTQGIVIHRPNRKSRLSSTFSITKDRSSRGSLNTHGTSILSTKPSDYLESNSNRNSGLMGPALSTGTDKRRSLTEAEKRRSIRLVSQTESVIDRRPLAEKRQSFIRNRASSGVISPVLFASSRRSSNMLLYSHLGSIKGSPCVRRQTTSSSLLEPPARNPRRLVSGPHVFPPGLPRAITPSPDRGTSNNSPTLPPGNTTDNWTTTDTSSSLSRDDSDARAAARYAKYALEMELPRHQRTWVRPGEASPTPPPSSVLRTSSNSREAARRRWAERLNRNSSGNLASRSPSPVRVTLTGVSASGIKGRKQRLKISASSDDDKENKSEDRLSKLVSNDSFSGARHMRGRKSLVQVEAANRISSSMAEVEDPGAARNRAGDDDAWEDVGVGDTTQDRSMPKGHVDDSDQNMMINVMIIHSAVVTLVSKACEWMVFNNIRLVGSVVAKRRNYKVAMTCDGFMSDRRKLYCLKMHMLVTEEDVTQKVNRYVVFLGFGVLLGLGVRLGLVGLGHMFPGIGGLGCGGAGFLVLIVVFLFILFIVVFFVVIFLFVVIIVIIIIIVIVRVFLIDGCSVADFVDRVAVIEDGMYDLEDEPELCTLVLWPLALLSHQVSGVQLFIVLVIVIIIVVVNALFADVLARFLSTGGGSFVLTFSVEEDDHPASLGTDKTTSPELVTLASMNSRDSSSSSSSSASERTSSLSISARSEQCRPY
ncbi:S-adenosyl-L-methionine-dependent methyltransferase, partial [Aureobasidium melanogenum]